MDKEEANEMRRHCPNTGNEKSNGLNFSTLWIPQYVWDKLPEYAQKILEHNDCRCSKPIPQRAWDQLPKEVQQILTEKGFHRSNTAEK